MGQTWILPKRPARELGQWNPWIWAVTSGLVGTGYLAPAAASAVASGLRYMGTRKSERWNEPPGVPFRYLPRTKFRSSRLTEL